jgi:hypothetical protein
MSRASVMHAASVAAYFANGRVADLASVEPLGHR